MAAQIAEVRLLCDKLLYRIQNLEQREKLSNQRIVSLKREVTRLRKEASTSNSSSRLPADPTLPTNAEKLGAAADATPRQEVRPLSTPDFAGAATHLTKERH